jgi:hypothetical protein
MTITSGVISALKKRAEGHNAHHASKAKLGTLKKVYERGARSFERVPFKGKKSQEEWALGRVDNFLFMLGSGEPMAGKSPADTDLLPEGHQMKSLMKADGRAGRDGDGDGKRNESGGKPSGSPPGSLAAHKDRQESNATYRAQTTSVIPERRFAEVYAPAASWGVVAPAAAGFILHSAYSGKPNIALLRNKLAGIAAKMGTQAAGKLGSVPLRGYSFMARQRDNLRSTPKTSPERVRSRNRRAFATRSANKIDRLSEKYSPAVGRFVNARLNNMSEVIAAAYHSLGRTPMERMKWASPFALGAAYAGGIASSALLDPPARFIDAWRPGQRQIERMEASGELRKLATARAVMKKRLAKQFDETKVKRDENGRFTFKTGGVIAAAGAAAIGAGLLLGRRGSINAAKRVFEAAIGAKASSRGRIATTAARDAVNRVVYDQGLKEKVGRVMQRTLQGGGKTMDAEKVKRVFGRVMDSQDKFTLVGKGVRTSIKRIESGIEYGVNATGNFAGKVFQRLGKEFDKNSSTIAKTILDDISKTSKEFSEASVAGKINMVAKLAGAIGTVGAAMTFVYDRYKDGFGKGWKTDYGFGKDGFFFKLQIAESEGGKFRDALTYSTVDGLKTHGIENDAPLQLPGATGGQQPQQQGGFQQPRPQGSAPPIDAAAQSKARFDRLRADQKLFEVEDFVALKSDADQFPEAKDIRNSTYKNVESLLSNPNTSPEARFKLADEIASMTNANPQRLLTAKQKFHAIAALIGKYDEKGNTIEGTTTESLEGTPVRYGHWRREGNNPAILKGEFEKYLDTYRFLNGKPHAIALNRLAEAARGVGWLDQKAFEDVKEMIGQKSWSEAHWRRVTGASTAPTTVATPERVAEVNASDARGERPFSEGAAPAPTPPAPESIRAQLSTASKPMFSDKRKATWEERLRYNRLRLNDRLTNSERKEAVENVKYYEKQLEEYERQAREAQQAGKSEASGGLAKVSQYDETKHRRNPKGNEGGGRFASKGGASSSDKMKQAGKEMASTGASTAAWMGTAAALARITPAGRLGAIAAKYLVPAAASLVTDYAAGKALGRKEINRSAHEEIFRIGGLVGGSVLGGRFRSAPVIGSSLGAAAGEQLGGITSQLLDRYGPMTSRRLKEKYQIA